LSQWRLGKGAGHLLVATLGQGANHNIYIHIHTYIDIHIISGFLKFPHFFLRKKATGPTVDPFFGRPRQGDFAADGLALGGAAGAASLRVGGAQGAAPRAALRGTTRRLGGWVREKDGENHQKAMEMWMRWKNSWFSW